MLQFSKQEVVSSKLIIYFSLNSKLIPKSGWQIQKKNPSNFIIIILNSLYYLVSTLQLTNDIFISSHVKIKWYIFILSQFFLSTFVQWDIK